MPKTKAVIIAGPTAAGKSSLAMALAEEFNGEIINADSMQVFRFMDIGTAKPSREDLLKVPHHLMDIVEPDEEYTVARYRADALEKIREIGSRGRNIFIAGGTGLYIKALTQGLFPGPKADKALRERLKKEGLEKGAEALHGRLKDVDPESAASIHARNTVRVIRALEVYELTKRPISEFHREHGFSESLFEALKIGLEKDRKALYADIEARIDRMVEDGLVEEVKGLLERYGADAKPMHGLGYREITGFIEGLCPLDEAIGLLKRNTRRYAKRQFTWFRKDPEIKWFTPERKNDIIALVRGFLS